MLLLNSSPEYYPRWTFMAQQESLMKETGLTSSVRKFMFVCSSINRNNFFSERWTPTRVHSSYTDQSEVPPSPPPRHTTHSQRKRKQKERKGIDGGLNMLFLLERHNFVYFNNVTINHSSPYHNLSEKWLITIGVCTQRLALGYLHTFSPGESYSDIGLFQDHCNYALVPHSWQHRKQLKNSYERYQRYLYSFPSSPQGGISPLAVHIQSQGKKKLGERLSRQAYGEFKVQHVL